MTDQEPGEVEEPEAAARRAYRADDPDLTEDDAVAFVADVYDAVSALLDRYGSLASADPEVAAGGTTRTRMSGGSGYLPGDRVTGRADGLSPAGLITKILLDRPRPLQDYGCFLPGDEELFSAADG